MTRETPASAEKRPKITFLVIFENKMSVIVSTQEILACFQVAISPSILYLPLLLRSRTVYLYTLSSQTQP